MKFLKLTILIVLISCGKSGSKSTNEKKVVQKPNILWITIEDWGADLSCYGTKGISTPNIDKLAAEGVRFENAFTTSPVCSTSRSAMMTGFYQNYINANQHRLTPDLKQPLPHGVKPIPHIFREAGYYTALMSWKTDCNFVPFKKEELFEGSDWRDRKEGQPFFTRITYGGTHRSWNRDSLRPIDIKDVEIPPYYANTDFVRRDWANGLEAMQLVDSQVGELLKRLEDDGLADNTIVVFISDHGRCHIRGKQFLYDGGIKIPMIVRWPGQIKPGTVNDDMVMSIDICKTILDAADIKPEVALHGQNLFGKEVQNRKYVFAARDKMDNTHDAMRAIRSKKYKLIQNLMPERAYLQYNEYKEGAYPVLAEMNILHMEGKLTPEQSHFFAATKPDVELFDLEKDPFEVHNVANDPAYVEVKEELLSELENWKKNVIKDQGVSDEFRAEGIFPDKYPTKTVDKWAYKNSEKYNFKKTGWPAWYPTRTLSEWKKAKAIWEPYVFRASDLGTEAKEVRPNVNTKPQRKRKIKKVKYAH
ncbi:sulfatase [Flavivirga amylovorans]|uniref:Sulfatase n=1 Tax=Flavivirga amylovorans TaxID=870486 RepID=A0ABT8WVW8_9FLAO|nr:sulfatase [Flavivirga amylovorans]MDO5985829.1 sulfatase [Flavivirga amylovorans]